MAAKQKLSIRNEDGMAMIEALPLIVVFVVFVSFGMGLFGVIHTAILNSIGSRAYAFETFRSRTNINFFREDGSALSQKKLLYLGRMGFRYHAVLDENDKRATTFVPTVRSIAIPGYMADSGATVTNHNHDIYNLDTRNQKINISPAWVMVGYGICLNSGCGN